MRRALTLLAILAFATPVLAQQSRSESQTFRSNGTLAIDISGMGTASVTISGTYSGTVSFRGLGDPNGDPQALLCAPPATPGTTVSSTTSTGIWVCPVAGLRVLEAVVTGYASGAVKIYLAASPGGGGSAGSATFSGAVTASSASDALTGAAVPAQASYTGLNIGGNLVGMTGFTLGTARAGAVAIVDGAGAQITSFGGGTQYATAAASATPTGTVALGWDGANVRALSTTSAGAMFSAQSGTWNLNNISGTISLPTGAATSAAQTTAQTSLSSIVTNTTGLATSAGITTMIGHVDGIEGLIGTTNTELANMTNSIGSTTSGQQGILSLGAVTTAAPTYTSGSSAGLSLQTDGALRVGGSISCSNCSGTGASSVDNSAWTFGTTSGAGAMNVVDDTSTNTVTENNVGLARMSSSRIPYFAVANAGGTLFGTVRDTGASDSLNVAIVDASGNQITTFGGGTQYTHDAALTVGSSIGTLAMGRASAAAPADVSADNDAVIPWYIRNGAQAIQPTFGGTLASTGTGTSGAGTQRVTIASDSSFSCANCSGSGVTHGDNAAFTSGTSQIVPIGGIFDDVSPATATENSASVGRITANKALHVNLRTAAGVEIPVMTTTEVAHDAALTVATTVGTPQVRRGVTALPTAASANDDAVLAASTLQGQGLVVPTAASFGGADNFSLQSAANDNATNVKAFPGTIYDISVVNTTATLYYLKLYNLASTPTCASATGFVESIPIPASTTGAGIVRTFPVGRAYSTGIGVCITSAGAPTSGGNAATGVYLSIGYK